MNTRLVNPNKSAEAGHTFDLGGVTAEVVALPGHTPINQGIFCPNEKVLFCADCIVTDYIPNLEVGNPDLWREWLKSLDKIDALAPNTIVPGHGRVIRRDEITEEISRISKFLLEAIQTGRAPTGNNQ
ncbi:MAG: MBL fold metallo-hydrolase [Chloroflexota bacterium]